MKTRNQRGTTTTRRLAGFGGELELSIHRVVIRLPHPKLFQLVVKAAVLAVFLLSIPWMKSAAIRRDWEFRRSVGHDHASLFLADLNRLGFLNPNADGRFVFLGEPGLLLQALLWNQIEPVQLGQQSEIRDSTVDFLFLDRTADFRLADRVLKADGILAVRLSSDSSDRFILPSNYKIVRITRPDLASTFVAVRKIAGRAYGRRKLLAVSESKREALNALKDAILEPPKKKKHRQKTRYLPDPLGGSLADYQPKKDLQFDVIRMDEGEGSVDRVGMNEWMRRNVKDEDTL